MTLLKHDEVFVFGSNLQGFHGAGDAGLACRGDAQNTWRQDYWFLQAMNAPVGSPLRVGKWAVYGCCKGFQEGREGKSYAIYTCTKPGAKRSVSLDMIRMQLYNLNTFAKDHPDLHFLVSKIGCGGAGYTEAEIKNVFRQWRQQQTICSNIQLPWSDV